LSEFIVGCVAEVRNTWCPSNLTRYTASPSSDADWPLERLMVARFMYPSVFKCLITHIVFPKIFFVLHWFRQIHFSSPVIIRLDHFRCVWAKNRRWKCGPLNFFHQIVRHPIIVTIYVPECLQMPYNTHMRYVKYLCDVSCRITWIIFNQY